MAIDTRLFIDERIKRFNRERHQAAHEVHDAQRHVDDAMALAVRYVECRTWQPAPTREGFHWVRGLYDGEARFAPLWVHNSPEGWIVAGWGPLGSRQVCPVDEPIG